MATDHNTLGLRLRAKLRAIVIIILAPGALVACAMSAGQHYEQPASATSNIVRGYTYYTSWGSLTPVAPGWAIATKHDTETNSELMAVDPNQDLTLVRIKGGENVQVAVPRIGEAVTAYGTGRMGDVRIASGIVADDHANMARPISGAPQSKNQIENRVPAAPVQWEHDHGFLISSSSIGPGFSGGPIYDTQGRLIGITEGYFKSLIDGRTYIFAFRSQDAMVEFRPKMQACAAKACRPIGPSAIEKAAIIAALILM
jgi:hypothetical protein